jgi:DNA-binding MarR family transcriptional regulator
MMPREQLLLQTLVALRAGVLYRSTIQFKQIAVQFWNMSEFQRDGIRYRALEDFRYEIRRFLNFSESAARKAGIEPQQHQALLSIKAARPGTKATVGFLAERLQVQHHSAVELSDRLEEKRLIRRSRSAADRREVLLSLTGRGEQLLQRLSESHRAELQTRGPTLLTALQGVIQRANASERRELLAGAARKAFAK